MRANKKTSMNSLFQRAMDFYEKGLWEPRSGALKRFVFGFLRRFVITTKHFVRERMVSRASALTYSTLFSIVPLLAVVFAIANGFGLSELTNKWIHESFVAQPELIDRLIGFVNSYLINARGGVFLGFGLILLLWTLLNLTGTIEGAFNQVWQVKRARSLYRKVTDYTAVFFLFPISVVVTVGFSVYIYSFVASLPSDQQVLKPAVLLLVKLLPSLLVWLFFLGLFMFMPNTKVNFKSAAIASLPTSLAFQVLQIAYLNSQVWLTSYNAIYGSFAALPLFMIMCQVSWFITLYGSTWAYVDQNIHSFYYGKYYLNISRRYHDYLCALLSASLCRRFAEKQKPGTAEQLAYENGIHIRLINDILYELCRDGVLMEISNDEKGGVSSFAPAYDINKMTLGAVLTAVDREGEELEIGPNETAWASYLDNWSEIYSSEYWNRPLYLMKIEFSNKKNVENEN